MGYPGAMILAPRNLTNTQRGLQYLKVVIMIIRCYDEPVIKYVIYSQIVFCKINLLVRYRYYTFLTVDSY